MKLRNYILCMAAIGVLVSCSDNEPILDNPEDPATMLSLAIDTRDLLTRAEGDVVKTDSTIANMWVLVYDKDKKLQAVGEAQTVGEVRAEATDIMVSPGKGYVLVVANVDEATIDLVTGKNATLNDINKAITTLDKEVDGYYTMSSDVKEVTFHPGTRNMMGYTPEEVTAREGYSVYRESNDYPPVKIYRTVARVRLLSVKVDDSKNEFATTISLRIDSMFMGNVKSQSYIANIANTGDASQPIEIPNSLLGETENWWYGRQAALLNKTYKTPEGKQEDMASLTKIFDVPYMLDESNEFTMSDYDTYFGKSFFVYENSNNGVETGQNEGYRTYLVLCGTYTYIDKTTGEEVTMETPRYYPIPINQLGSMTYDKNVIQGKHVGVRRNNSYNLIVTVFGPGSDEPWTPSEFINLNAKVVVTNWKGKVDIEETVE